MSLLYNQGFLIKGFWFFIPRPEAFKDNLHFACIPAALLLYRLAHLPILLELQACGNAVENLTDGVINWRS